MKRKLGKIVALVLALVLAASFAPRTAQAASAKARVKKLVKSLESYEYSTLFNTHLEIGEKREVKLSARQKALAAALAINLEKTVVEEEDEFYITYFVKSSAIKKMSKKLFGKAVSDKKLPVKDSGKVGEFLTAFRTYKGRAVVYVWQYETETDHAEISFKLKKNGTGYVVTKDVYYGYWGMNDGKTANYRVTYNVEKNEKSSYGFAVTGITIEKIG